MRILNKVKKVYIVHEIQMYLLEQRHENKRAEYIHLHIIRQVPCPSHTLEVYQND